MGGFEKQPEGHTPDPVCTYCCSRAPRHYLGEANAFPTTAGWQPSREDSRVLGAFLYLPVTVGYKFDYVLTFDFLNAAGPLKGAVIALVPFLLLSLSLSHVVLTLWSPDYLRPEFWGWLRGPSSTNSVGFLRCGTCLLQVLQETGVLCRVPEGTWALGAGKSKSAYQELPDLGRVDKAFRWQNS